MNTFPTRKTQKLRRIAFTTALGTALVGTTAVAQDSVRDRLSPGNGADWAGEPHAGPNEYDQSVDRNQFNNQYYGYGNNGTYQGRSVSPSYFRDSRTGRYFYLDDNNRAVFDQTDTRISGQPVLTPGSQWSPQAVQGPQSGQSRGPLLGVAIEDTEQGVRVLDVAPNSAAQQAGIQAGDTIVSFNGTAADQFSANTITSQVGQMTPGQSLPLVVRRNGQEQQITATLGSPSANARYQAAKPAVQSDSAQALQQRVEELQNKVDRLEQKINQMSAQGAEPSSDAADLEPLNLNRPADGSGAPNSGAPNSDTPSPAGSQNEGLPGSDATNSDPSQADPSQEEANPSGSAADAAEQNTNG